MFSSYFLSSCTFMEALLNILWLCTICKVGSFIRGSSFMTLFLWLYSEGHVVVSASWKKEYTIVAFSWFNIWDCIYCIRATRLTCKWENAMNEMNYRSSFLPSEKTWSRSEVQSKQVFFPVFLLVKKQESDFPIVTQSNATLLTNVSVGRRKSQLELLGGNIKKLTVLSAFSHSTETVLRSLMKAAIRISTWLFHQ